MKNLDELNCAFVGSQNYSKSTWIEKDLMGVIMCVCINQIMPEKLILYICSHVLFFGCNTYNLGNPFLRENTGMKSLYSCSDLAL